MAKAAPIHSIQHFDYFKDLPDDPIIHSRSIDDLKLHDTSVDEVILNDDEYQSKRCTKEKCNILFNLSKNQ